MIRYVFKEEPLIFKNADKADAQKMGEEVARHGVEAGGPIDVNAIVDGARERASAFHDHLEWDDKKAAHIHRCDQVRAIIRSIRIVSEEIGEEPVRAFVSVADRGTAYRHINDVRASPHLSTLVLKQAERDLNAFMQRYRELEDVCKLAKSARAKVRKRIAEMESRVAA